MVMIITGLDLETTGLDFDKGDRIIEVCLDVHRLDGDDLVRIKTITQRINPMRAISKEAQQVHNIALEDLKAAPKWEEFAPTVAKILASTDMLVIHNAAFDMPFIAGEMRRVGSPVRLDLQAFCTMENGRWATFDGKRPSLKELCWSLGVEYDATKAHGADYDTHLMMECYTKGQKLGLFEKQKR